jgi:hypothetical protein
MHMPAIPRIVTSESVMKSISGLSGSSVFLLRGKRNSFKAATNKATAKEADMSISVKKKIAAIQRAR